MGCDCSAINETLVKIQRQTHRTIRMVIGNAAVRSVTWSFPDSPGLAVLQIDRGTISVYNCDRKFATGLHLPFNLIISVGLNVRSILPETIVLGRWEMNCSSKL